MKKIQLRLTTIGVFLISIMLSNIAVAQCNDFSVLGLSPSEGPVQTQVTITGNGFTSGNVQMNINGTLINTFSVLSDTEISLSIPVGASEGPIAVTIDSCTENTTDFTVLEGGCAGNDELYISELYDHESGSYGMIELYNPSANTINFNGEYVLERAGDIGGAASYSLVLPNSIGPGETYLVLCGSGPGCNLPEDAILGAGINEDDEFKLFKNGNLLDIARAPENRGYTVIRNASVTAPTVTYNVTDWTFSLNDCSNLGTHIDTSTGGAATASIIQQPQDQNECENSSMDFTVTVDNPSGFSYQWKSLDASGNWVNVTNDAIHAGATTANLGLVNVPLSFDGRQYYCEITSTSCNLISDAVQVQVYEIPQTPVITTTQPDCTTNTGSISVDSPLNSAYTYSLDGVNFQTNPVFSNLSAGNYTVTVQGPGNCTSTSAPVVIDAAPQVPAIPQVSLTQPESCGEANGEITVTAPLGVDYTYSLDGVNFQSNPTFSNLEPGTYSVYVQQAAACQSNLTDVILNPGTNLAVQTTQACQETLNGKAYILEVLPENNSFELMTTDFTWLDADGVVVGNNENTFNVTDYIQQHPNAQAPYLFTVIIWTQDCEAEATFEVSSYFCSIPEGFSPNGDGINDNFDLEGLQVSHIQIFNRMGRKVYAKNNYTNEWYGQSDGGSSLPTATYYYQIETTLGDIYKGWVYLNR